MKQLLRSFGHAFRGLCRGLRLGQNMALHCLAVVVVTACGLLAGFAAWQIVQARRERHPTPATRIAGAPQGIARAAQGMAGTPHGIAGTRMVAGTSVARTTGAAGSVPRHAAARTASP